MTNDAPSPAETYEHYLSPAMADPFTRILLEIVGPQRGERVLDLACGTGSVARGVAPMIGTDGKVLALDINPDMLAVGQAQAAPTGALIEWREGSAVTLGLQDESFDLVLCQQGLQFFSDRPASLREMHRVLTAEGRAGISVWQSLDQHPLYREVFESTARHLGVAIADVSLSFSLGDADELRMLLNDAGFRRVEIHPRSLEVFLPMPERFVQLMVMGAATTVPLFAKLDSTARAELVEAVKEDTREVVHYYGDGDELRFMMFTHIVVAHG
jgi:ubiquinone/menaquinone biosynthesis C-methylase UbiE